MVGWRCDIIQVHGGIEKCHYDSDDDFDQGNNSFSRYSIAVHQSRTIEDKDKGQE